MIVWKSHHEQVVALLRERIADKESELVRTRQDLADAQMRERVLIAQADAPQEVQRPLVPKREPSKIDSAIALASSGDRRLRQHLTDFARRMQMDGMSEDDIAQRIIDGDPSSDDDGIDE